MKKVCIVGASGKLGQYMVRHTLERSVGKLNPFKGRITIFPE